MFELRHKKEVYKRLKQDQVAQKEYIAPVVFCKYEVRKVKASPELNLER